MAEQEYQIPLVYLYGEEAIDLALKEIEDLKFGSNIPFDTEYVKLGISFLNLKSNEILEGKKNRCNLKALVSESFGEAAIYKYNIMGGNL